MPHAHNHSISLGYVKNRLMILYDKDKTLITRHLLGLVYAPQTRQRSRPTNHYIFDNPPKTFRHLCKCHLFASHIPAIVLAIWVRRPDCITILPSVDFSRSRTISLAKHKDQCTRTAPLNKIDRQTGI